MWKELCALLGELNLFSTVVRLALALILGGILAGIGVAICFMQGGSTGGTDIAAMIINKYRTISYGKIVVCMASALVMLTGEYLVQEYGTGDPARLGAQVISGIGFLGAGTIIITSRQVKGLTTAAGLWAAACMGLAIGAGFYAGAVICGTFLLLVMAAMSRLDAYLLLRSRQINFFAEFKSMEALGRFMRFLRDEGYKLYNIEINRNRELASDLIGATFWVGLNGPADHVETLHNLSRSEDVKYLQELEIM